MFCIFIKNEKQSKFIGETELLDQIILRKEIETVELMVQIETMIQTKVILMLWKIFHAVEYLKNIYKYVLNIYVAVIMKS